jgi:predicted phosphodiesterase
MEKHRMILIVSDLHFTSKPADEYRWALFPQVIELAREHNVSEIYVLGDLCEAKDNHAAKLVNRVVDGLIGWTKSVGKVTILRGNHDGINEDFPYFRFLDQYPDIRFISKPLETEDGFLFLPHSRNPLDEWKNIDLTDKIVFAHVTVNNVIAESGQKLFSSVGACVFEEAKLAFSGDIHKKQKVEKLIYIGAPYNVRFGDDFEGAGVLLNEKVLEWKYVPLQFPRRYTIDIKSTDDLKAAIEPMLSGDQVKVRLHLDQDNMHKWREIRDQVRILTDNHGMGLILHGFEIKTHQAPTPIKDSKNKHFTDFAHYCDMQKVSKELIEVGHSIIQEAG